MSYSITCFVCEADLESGMLFCINCGQDQRLRPDDNKFADLRLSEPIAADTYILAKNYIPNQFSNLAVRYLQILDENMYIWTPFPDSAYEFTTREELDNVRSILRDVGQDGPMQIIIRKGK